MCDRENPPKILKDHAQVSFVLKVPFQADHVFLVLWVRMLQLLQYFNFFYTSLFPVKRLSRSRIRGIEFTYKLTLSRYF